MHLDRQPRADPAGGDPRDEDGQATEGEAEARAIDPASEHQEEEQRFQARHPWARDPKRGATGRQDAEHRDAARIKSPSRHLDRQQHKEQRCDDEQEDRGVVVVRTVHRAGG